MDSWEPRSSCESLERIRQYADRFDLILTLDETLLDLPNTRLFVGGSSWVYPWLSSSKEFSVSFLCTSHNFLPGYQLRHQLWANQHRIYRLPRKFWSSRMHPVDTNRLLPQRNDGFNDKTVLFDSMFSICPENTSQRNYFTEKILDCFVTKTVPIYWGCPNIGDYFDERGIVLVSDLEDLVSKVNNLTIDTYEKMLPYVDQNYKLSLAYCKSDGKDRMVQEILKYRSNP